MDLPPPPPRTVERCYRHPAVATGVHCTRCSRPICPDCMVPAPVGHHCPTCVEEARREFRRGPGRRVRIVQVRTVAATRALLIALAAVYLLEVAVAGPGSLLAGPGSRSLIDLGGQIALAPSPDGPIGVATGQYWRLLTAIFLHGGLLHLAMNAWVLWVIGGALERELGRWRFLAVFLTTGLFASAASYALGDAVTALPGGGVAVAPVVSVGASGAIFGLFGTLVARDWRRRHLALANARLRQVLPWVVLNLALSFTFPVIDWRAHVGGLVAGLVAGTSIDDARWSAPAALVATLAATVALTAWGTARIHALVPGL